MRTFTDLSTTATMADRARAAASCLSVAALLAAGAPAQALELTATDAGFVTPMGGSSKGDGAGYNYSVGYELHYPMGSPSAPFVPMDRKNYFVFDLSSVGTPVGAATLKLWSGVLESADAFETYVLKETPDQPGALFDTGTLASTPHPGGFDEPTDFAIAVAASLYMKLAAGPTALASLDITHADDMSFVMLDFTPAGVAHLNGLIAAGGPAVLGGLVSTVDTVSGIAPQQPFGFTGPGIPGPLSPTLILTLVPEPATVLMLAAGLGGIALRLAGQRQRRRRAGPTEAEAPQP